MKIPGGAKGHGEGGGRKFISTYQSFKNTSNLRKFWFKNIETKKKKKNYEEVLVIFGFPLVLQIIYVMEMRVWKQVLNIIV